MTKKELFNKIVEPIVLNGLKGAYHLTFEDLTDKQIMFMGIICDELYDKFGNKLSLSDLQEMKG